LQNEGVFALYIIQKGQVRITFDTDLLMNPNVSSLKYDNLQENDNSQSSPEFLVEKTEGSYFGEWALIGEHIGSLRAVAMGDVVCAVLTKEKIDSVVGPFTKLSQDDHKYVISYFYTRIPF
jgi:CRP-like cAMP-binding protein